MVGAYKVSLIEEQLKYLIKVPSILLPNLILGERAIPEKLQKECTPAALGAELAAIVREGAARTAQLDALSRLDRLMALPDGGAPSAHAARAVLETIAARRASLRRGRRPRLTPLAEREQGPSAKGCAILDARSDFNDIGAVFAFLEPGKSVRGFAFSA